MSNKMEASNKFQGLCLVAVEGYRLMEHYDYLPPMVRKRLQDSPFNLCPACVMELTAERASKLRARQLDPQFYLHAIETMENMIRCEEVQ
jgi:hypothetical protein